MSDRIHNFSAGPATLPVELLEKAQSEFLNYGGAGMALMEMSHRSKEFISVIESAESDVRELLNISDDYAVLFLQGGASLQFSMVPQNLFVSGKPVLAVNTGSWTKKAIKEMKREGDVAIIGSSDDRNFSYIPKIEASEYQKEGSFVYIASNNTIFGTQWESFPDTASPLVADMSSDILSRPFDINKFGLVFAGAQKNLGPSGVTLVIIRKDLAERASENLPTMMQYRTHIDGKSLYNTPPTFGIYMIGLMLQWIKSKGGLSGIESLNNEKAALLYDAIDSSDFYYNPTQKDSRSLMNVVFRVSGDNEELEALFVKEATAAGLSGLKGHRSVGGLRASIYNSQRKESVQALVDFMQKFELEHKNEAVSQSQRTA